MLLPTVASLAVVPHAAALAVAVASLAELLESMPAAQLGIMDASRLFYTANHSEAAELAQTEVSHDRHTTAAGKPARRRGVPGGAERERVGDGQGLTEDSVFKVEGRGRGPEVGVRRE